MISHKYKCIFIHIPRTGGTSLETHICGKDWWKINSGTKHLIASTAKKVYKEHWDDYFKFSFVRNPWARMASMVKYAHSYGVCINNGKLDVSGYLTSEFVRDGREVDPRTVSADDEFPPATPNCVYGNILNEELDFVGRLENIEQDSKFILKTIGFPELKTYPKVESRHIKRTCGDVYTNAVKEEVSKLYGVDIDTYGYEYDPSL